MSPPTHLLLLTLTLLTTTAHPSPPLIPRLTTGAGVNITVYNDTHCSTSATNRSFTYGEMIPTPFTAQSYTLSRYLSSTEQLDWSTPFANGAAAPAGSEMPQQCGQFLQTTNPDSNGNPLHDGTCYGLMGGGATCVNLWNVSAPPEYIHITDMAHGIGGNV